MVRIATQIYAVPLVNIQQIARLADVTTKIVNGNPVMLMRDSILPLLNMRNHFEIDCNDQNDTFVVIVTWANKSIGLIVDEILGQQEVVIKPLDDMFSDIVEVNGATVRDDGRINLILDVGGVIATVNNDAAHAA